MDLSSNDTLSLIISGAARPLNTENDIFHPAAVQKLYPRKILQVLFATFSNATAKQSNCTIRRNCKGKITEEPSCWMNEIELSKVYVQRSPGKCLGHPKLLSGRRRMLPLQNSHIFCTNRKPQEACNNMLVAVILNKGVIVIREKQGFHSSMTLINTRFATKMSRNSSQISKSSTKQSSKLAKQK